MSFQAYLDNVEKKTGKTLNDFIAEAKDKKLTDSKSILAWLKKDYDLGTGHVKAVSYASCTGPSSSSNTLLARTTTNRARSSSKDGITIEEQLAPPRDTVALAAVGELMGKKRPHLWHPDTLQPMPFDTDKYFGLVREATAVQESFQLKSREK